MIQNWGYTDDGLVFMNINVNQQGKPGMATIMFTPDDAREAAKALNEAADEAEKKILRRVH